MQFDFNSAIENARYFAARAEALRRNSGHPFAVEGNAGVLGPRPKGARPGTRGRLLSGSVPKVTPFAHAH